MRKNLFLLSASALAYLDYGHFPTSQTKIDFTLPKISKFKSSVTKQTKKNKKSRLKEHRAKQARKINYQNQKKGIKNPTHKLSKTHKSWKDNYG